MYAPFRMGGQSRLRSFATTREIEDLESCAEMLMLFLSTAESLPTEVANMTLKPQVEAPLNFVPLSWLDMRALSTALSQFTFPDMPSSVRQMICWRNRS